MRKKQKTVDVNVFIAVSAQGHPTPYIGYSFQAKMLRAFYLQKFGHTLKAGGYRVVKVRLIEDQQ